MNYYRTNRTNKIKQGIVYTALMIAGSIIMAYAFGNAIDKHIDNQDIMLCKSAKISGNEEYLSKCACYYQSDNIECIQK